MLQKLHKNAKTNYLIRQEIKNSTASIAELSRRFNISWLTVKKWKSRSEVSDKSSRPDNVRTSLSKEQEDLIIFERKKYKKVLMIFTLPWRGRFPSSILSKFSAVLKDTDFLYYPMN